MAQLSGVDPACAERRLPLSSRDFVPLERGGPTVGHAVFVVVHFAVLVLYPPAIFVTLLGHALLTVNAESLNDAREGGGGGD